MKYTIAIILILVSVNCFGQTPAPINQDSVKKVQEQNIKLYKESFSANASLIDSTFKRLHKILAWESFEQYKDAYNYFIEAMFQVWLDNRKKKK